MLKISNYRPPQIIERDPKESTYEVGDDKFSPLTEKQIVEKYNKLFAELTTERTRADLNYRALELASEFSIGAVDYFIKKAQDEKK